MKKKRKKKQRWPARIGGIDRGTRDRAFKGFYGQKTLSKPEAKRAAHPPAQPLSTSRVLTTRSVSAAARSIALRNIEERSPLLLDHKFCLRVKAPIKHRPAWFRKTEETKEKKKKRQE